METLLIVLAAVATAAAVSLVLVLSGWLPRLAGRGTPMFRESGPPATRNERVRQRLAAMYEGWRALIVDTLSAAREAGRVRKDIDVEVIASVLIAVVEGSIMQSRLAPESVRLEEMVEPLSRTLAEWLEPSKAP